MILKQRAPAPPADLRFAHDKLIFPTTIPDSALEPFLRFRGKATTARANYELWGDGSVRDMGTGAAVSDPAVVAHETRCAQVARAQDAAWGLGLPDRRFSGALRVDFLVALTFKLDLWDWPTRDVVVFLAKASTELWRCRFSDHPSAKAYTGYGDALASHSWANTWGVLVAAVAQGGPLRALRLDLRAVQPPVAGKRGRHRLSEHGREEQGRRRRKSRAQRAPR